VLPDPPSFKEFLVRVASDKNGEISVKRLEAGAAGRLGDSRRSPRRCRDRAIIVLAARHRLPAVYPFRYLATEGGLISYGPDQIEQWRGAATYVDRILRGEKPGDLPVQAPTKFELVINMKTAKALGLNIPPALPLRADEVIE
jgi:ABC transporter substrate binding protein